MTLVKQKCHCHRCERTAKLEVCWLGNTGWRSGECEGLGDVQLRARYISSDIYWVIYHGKFWLPQAVTLLIQYISFWSLGLLSINVFWSNKYPEWLATEQGGDRSECCLQTPSLYINAPLLVFECFSLLWFSIRIDLHAYLERARPGHRSRVCDLAQQPLPHVSLERGKPIHVFAYLGFYNGVCLFPVSS